MYPNPQEALPLPSRPDVHQYKKLAKELVKACRSGDPDAIRAWSVRWVTSLAARSPKSDAPHSDREITEAAGRVERFAREKLTSGEDPTARCSLTGAQFVIARAHGFLSWPKFVKHIESVVLTGSRVSAFEAAAQAIVSGDLETVKQLLRQHPDLIRARSTREHRATLLHYVSANGVEGYMQVSPKNIAGITEVLVAAGADVDADADVYGGRCTTLGLVATSSPPRDAGVQLEVIDVLLRFGARMDLPGIVGNGALIRGCLANGQPEAASYLVSRGAPLDLVGAAGVGRIDVVQGFFGDDAGGSRTSVSRAAVAEAFAFACIYGQTGVVEFLLRRGFEVDTELRNHGEGHTGLHVAAFHGHLEVVKLLLSHGAGVEVIDRTWGTAPLMWALTGWSQESPPDADRFYDVIAQLVAAGANVTPDLLEWERTRADPKMLAALTPDPI
jgi:hypothetical protein